MTLSLACGARPRSCSDPNVQVAFTLVDIGAAFLARDGPEAARPVLEKALESLEASAGYDSVKLVKCLVELGKVGAAGRVPALSWWP